MEKKKIYVLMMDSTADMESIVIPIGAYTSKDSAIKALKERRNLIINDKTCWEYDAYKEWRSYDDKDDCRYQVDESEEYFYIYLDGHACEWQTTLKIKECELRD